MNRDTNSLQAKIGYTFRNRDLLKTALIHPSYSGETNMKRTASNQRLEFLGDAVLELTVSEYLYRIHPDTEEGELTRKRSSLVFEAALDVCARGFDLQDYIYLGRGEESQGGRSKPSIVSDAFEALVGAIYLDGGLEAAAAFIDRFLLSQIDELSLLNEGKSIIQNYVQQHPGYELRYEDAEVGVPGDSLRFRSELFINGQLVSSGLGQSKKNAEKDAAAKACVKLGVSSMTQ